MGINRCAPGPAIVGNKRNTDRRAGIVLPHVTVEVILGSAMVEEPIERLEAVIRRQTSGRIDGRRRIARSQCANASGAEAPLAEGCGVVAALLHHGAGHDFIGTEALRQLAVAIDIRVTRVETSVKSSAARRAYRRRIGIGERHAAGSESVEVRRLNLSLALKAN